MNTKGIKFLAVLAVLAMAFAAFAVGFSTDSSDASDAKVEVDGLTFNFGGTETTTINYGESYGSITIADVQNLAAELDEATNTIKLSGDLVKLDNAATSGSVLTIKKMYGGASADLPALYGVAFQITNLNVGAKVMLNAGESTIDGSKSAELYQPINGERTSSSVTSFTVTVKEDGVHSKVYTIDFSQLVKAQLGTTKYFTVADAVAKAASGNTVKILNDTTLKSKVIIEKPITIESDAADKKTVTGTFVYDLVKLTTATASAAGAVTIQNLKIITDDVLGYYNYTAAGNLNLSLVWKNCDIEMTGQVNLDGGYPTIMVYGAKAKLEVTGCTLTNKYASEAGSGLAIYYYNTAADGKPSMKVNGCTFNGYARCIVMNKPGTLEITDNKVASGIKDTNGFRFFVQLATTTNGYFVNDVSLTMSGNSVASDLTEISSNPVKYVNFHGNTSENPEVFNIKSVTVDGSVFIEEYSKVVLAANTALSGGEFTIDSNGVLQNAGTVTIADGLSNKGTITNTSKLNLGGDYSNVNGATSLVNTGGTIICETATLYKLVKNDGIAGTLEVAGSSPSDEPSVPEEKAADAQGKVPESDAKVVIATGTVKQATPKADQAIVISTLGADAVLDVSNTGSEISIMNGAMTAEQTATVKTATSTVTVKGITGNVTFSSGSIIVVAAPWSGGDIILKNGDVLKLSGEITAVAGIDFTGTGSATVIIEEGDAKKLTLNNTLTIKNANINVVVEGTIEGTGTLDMNKGGELSVKGTVDTAITGKAKITVDGETNSTITSTKAVTINGTANGLITTSETTANVTINGKATAGVTSKATVSVYGKLSGPVTLNDTNAKLIAYQASDINSAYLPVHADCEKVSGKDASGGTWTYSGGNTLKLDNYSGVFNLGVVDYDPNGDADSKDAVPFANTITTIILSGDSEIIYTLPETAVQYALFSAVTSIKTVQGEGSLDIELDISKATKVAVDHTHGIAVIGHGGNLSLSSVNVSFTVKGTNTTWDLEDTMVFGIAVANLKMNSSNLAVDVLSSINAEKTSGIDCKTLSLASSGIIASAAGTGIDVYLENGAIDFVATLSDGSAILTTGKVLGMSIVNVTTEGPVYNDALELSGASSVGVANGFAVGGDVELSQSSIISAEKFEYVAGKLTNNATVTLSDSSVIKNGAEIDNLATLTNKGTISVFGKLDNQGGTFTNEGTVTLYAKEYNAAAGQHTDFTTATDPSKIGATSAELFKIEIKEATPQDNGTLKITKATAYFKYKDNADLDGEFKDLDAFKGTLTPVQNTAEKYYTLSLTNGTASITLTYGSGDPELGKAFTLTVSGTIVKNVGGGKFSVAMPSGTSKAVTDGISAIIKDATPGNTYLKVSGGKMVNSSVVNFYGVAASEYELVSADAEYEGSINAGAQTLTVVGKLTGDITSKGAVKVTDKGLVKGNVSVTGAVTVGNDDNSTAKISGNVTTKGAITIKAKASIEGDITSDSTVTSEGGAIKGNVTSKGDVTVYNVDGNITVDKNGDYKVTIKGKVVGTLTYNSAAKAKVPGEGEKVDPTTYPVVMTIDADLTKSAEPKALIINLIKAVDATETEAVKPGYMTIGSADVADLDDGKNVNLTMKVGKLQFPDTMTMPVRYAIVFEADTIAEVASVATIDFSNSALKVSKDATSNFVTGTTPVTDYGLVKAIMSFSIESGAYTIYSGVTYALANCEENSELTVELDATLTDNVEVKAGVNVIISDKVTLDFDKYGIDMADGAKITLVGTGKVTFKATSQNLYPGDDTKDYDYYTVNGTIVFDTANSILLKEVRFSGEGASTIKGVAATSTASSKIDLDVTYNQGLISTVTGEASGKVALENTKYYATKEDAEDDKYTQVCAILLIAEDTLFDATSITDMAMDAELDASNDVVIKMIPTIVTVNGVLNLNGNTTVNGLYTGEGTIVLAKNKEITVPQSTRLVIDAETEDFYYFGGVFNGEVTNALVGGDTITIVGLMANYELATDKVVLTAYEGSSDAYFKLKGQMLCGDILSEELVIDGLTIADDASVAADLVKVTNATTINGELAVKVIDADSVKKLVYDTTYEALGYTVYTVFKNIDFDVITDVTIADSKSLTQLGVEKKLDLSGKDVNITVAEGKTLTIDVPLIIGTPIDALGDEGSSIVGKIVIMSSLYDVGPYDRAYRYIVAYSDVDLSGAEILQANGKDAAVYSILAIDDILYATIFANEGTYDEWAVEVKYGAGVGLAVADKSIVPDIPGFVFTKWSNLNEDANAAVGETNAYANAKAVAITVVFKSYAGVNYYLNGTIQNILDAPVEVAYGSIVTAKISDTSKYQGTPLVNGASYVEVDYLTDTITASGVTPIPEPTPEPVEENTGLSLTDILLIVLVILIAIMVVILVLRLNRS